MIRLKTRARLLCNWFTSGRTQIWAWGIWTVIWVVLMPITLVTALKVSLEWVVFMSLFANCASTGTAWVAAMGYQRSRKVDEANMHEKLDHIIKHSPDIPPLASED